ncbi:hypothetical protein DQ238_00445 [Geodermatophilus sp. TF02-6]|uniref:hypothetical protein n=1 Tax=Geodermatophilus sp. TF02-6 TaxID=2250575 RepID=UPI000DEB5D9F|nr:hypothetical protein [Geodermatophilus sp. TF02-6]RBY83601.1 hypothetical protein DQ238_00445 [Geodermatophilus sp. TF02-6]
MQGTGFAIAATTPDLGLPAALRRRLVQRRARRVLERELADYATAADRDDLVALITDRAPTGSDAAAILDRQTRRELFRLG